MRPGKTAVVAIALSMALSLSSCSAIAELGPIADAGDGFMKTMKAGDNKASYAMLAAPLQKEIGGTEGWAKFAEPRVPKEWSFSNKSISNGEGKLEGSADFANGQHLDVSLTLVKENADWKVIGIHFGK
jgi:hypothetical protein